MNEREKGKPSITNLNDWLTFRPHYPIISPIMQLNAEKRTLLGKRANKLRKNGKILAVVFEKGEESTPITLDEKEFKKGFKEAGESTLIDVSVDGGKPVKVLISEVQHDPVFSNIIHVNLHAVKLTDKITAAIPVEIIGENELVKNGKALLLTLLPEIEVECLPTDLPAKFEIDISGLVEIDQGIKISDLAIDKSKISIDQDENAFIVRLDYAEMKEEVVEEEATPAEAKVIGEEEVAEGEEGVAPAEGEATKEPAGEKKEEKKKEK